MSDIVEDIFVTSLRRASQILGTDIADLVSLQLHTISTASEHVQYRDKRIAEYGPTEEYPHYRICVNFGIQSPFKQAGIGFVKLQCRQYPDIEYLSCSTLRHDGTPYEFVIAKRSDVWRLRRASARAARDYARTILQQPILQANLLDSIVNKTIGFIKNSKKIEKYGARLSRGLIFDGTPGNGKTMTCKYLRGLANQHGIPHRTVAAGHIDKSYTEGSLNTLFSGYQLTFFDDVDISYFQRKGGNGKIACDILSAMDGLGESHHALVRIFTTNEKLSDMDSAFRRPGRIDDVIHFPTPDQDLVRQLIQTWPEEIICNIFTEKLVTLCDTFSFAEVEAVRSNLVAGFLDSGIWDMDTAVNEVKTRRDAEKGPSRSGFFKAGRA